MSSSYKKHQMSIMLDGRGAHPCLRPLVRPNNIQMSAQCKTKKSAENTIQGAHESELTCEPIGEGQNGKTKD